MATNNYYMLTNMTGKLHFFNLKKIYISTDMPVFAQ